jgi:hypothetical protein
VEGLHAVGDIITKISVNCVLNYMLHYYLCVYFYGFFLWWFILVFISMGISCLCCMYMLLLFPYESMHLQNVFVYFKFNIYKVPQEFCVYMF